jgi:hypothetical protein
VNMTIILDIVHWLRFFKHNIPEAGPVSASRCQEGYVHSQLGSLEQAEFPLPNRLSRKCSFLTSDFGYRRISARD